MSEQFDEQGNELPDRRRRGAPGRMGRPGQGGRWHKAGDKAGMADDDVEGHRAAMDKAGLDGRRATTSRATGPPWTRPAGPPTRPASSDDDVEGHLEQIEVDDDVIGKAGLQVQPPRDADNQGNQF